jgi:hypothetical protein
MEESFLSFSCPCCKKNLLETSLLKLGFIKSTPCPYCGATVRWARGSLFTLLFGMVCLGIGIHCIKNEITLFADKPLVIAVVLGVGATALLLGIIITRFETVSPKGGYGLPRTRVYYPTA